MSEANKKKQGYLIVGLGVFVCSILLGYISLFIAFGEYDISRSTIISMLITSGVLFVVGIIILSLWAARKKPDAQTSDDSKQEESEGYGLSLRENNIVRKTWKPIVGGLLSIASGLPLLIIGLVMSIGEYGEGALIALVYLSPFLIVFGIAPIVGGIFALKRKRWHLALLGSIGGIFAFYLAVPAIVLIAISRGEFE